MLCMFINKLSLRVTTQLVRLLIYLVFRCDTTVEKFKGQCFLLLFYLVLNNLLPALCTTRSLGTVCNDISIKYHEWCPNLIRLLSDVIYYKMTPTALKQLIVAGWGLCVTQLCDWVTVGDNGSYFKSEVGVHSHESVSVRSWFCNRSCSPLRQLHSPKEERKIFGLSREWCV